jgi:hypothetical protein
MKPEIGTAWRRRTDAPKTRCLRFEKCRVIESTDELTAGEDDVLFVCIGERPKSAPGADDEWPMAMDVKNFLEEYEPLQMSLF